MLTQGRFLISYQVFDNIQIRDYLKYPGEELIPEHLHMINALKEIQNYWDLTSEKVIITDIIPIPQPG